MGLHSERTHTAGSTFRATLIDKRLLQNPHVCSALLTESMSISSPTVMVHSIVVGADGIMLRPAPAPGGIGR